MSWGLSSVVLHSFTERDGNRNNFESKQFFEIWQHLTLEKYTDKLIYSCMTLSFVFKNCLLVLKTATRFFISNAFFQLSLSIA